MKIIVRLRGGIGNQLFIYAAGRRCALVNNAELVIDHSSGFIKDHQYKRKYQLDHFMVPCRKASAAERFEPFPYVRRFLSRNLNAWRPFERRTFISQEGIDFDPRILSLRLNGSTYLEGYWQSEGYFKDCESQIREDLCFVAPTDVANTNTVAFIKEKISVAVHVRFFDFPQEGMVTESFSDNVSNGYYDAAIREMERHVPGAHYFIFSDRPEFARRVIPLADNRITLISHNSEATMAYADLWLMSHCHHFIIANSTFSWWGAWLSKHLGKVVIAPNYEKRDGTSSWGFKGLIPNDWMKVDVAAKLA